MGTETFTAFKSDGTAYKLKGRILRHLDNDPVTEADKSNIRSTLGITGQGGLGDLLAANNLDDLSNAATARTNLSVNSIAEDAEAIGTKLLGPSVYFDGTNDYVEVADDQRLSFTNGTDDLPFSVSAWVKMEDATNFSVLGKNDGSIVREYQLTLDGSDKLQFSAYTDNLNYRRYVTSSALTSYEGSWIHVAATYAGAGPNSGVAFTAALPILYINGQSVALSDESAGTYTGMSDTVKNLWIGRTAGTYAKGHIRNVQIFDYELSATEVAELARGNELGYSDQWGGNTVGAVYTSDFSTDTNGNTGIGGTTTGNIDGIGGQNDNLRLAINSATSDHYFTKGGVFTVGIRYRMEFNYYIPNTNAVLDSISAGIGEAAEKVVAAPTLNQWNHFSVDSVAVGGPATGRSIYIFGRDGGVRSFAGNGTDVMYVRNIQVTQIGTLADFRSERFDSSTGKWYDLSDNAFVGTNSGATLVGREVPVYESSGTFTPTLTFGGGSTGMTFTEQGGYYTRIGDTVFVRGIVFLSAKGSSTGSAKLGGLPFTSSAAGSASSVVSVYATSMAALTSSIVGLVDDGGTGITLSDTGAAGAVDLDETNFGNSSIVRFSATYQIQ